MKSKWIWWGSILVITLLTSGYPQEAEATAATYDAAAEFSATNNPNGVWSYGWSTALGSAFNLGIGFVRDGLNGWGGFIAGDGNPSVLHNGTSSTIMLDGILPVPPGALVVHPGTNDEKQIVRWTAPAAGGYAVAATFTRIHFGGTDVHVLHNGSSIFAGAVNQTTNTASFSATLVRVNAGDAIDFVVGFGSNGEFFGDSTTLTAVITPLDIVNDLVTLAADVDTTFDPSPVSRGPAGTFTITATFTNTSTTPLRFSRFAVTELSRDIHYRTLFKSQLRHRKPQE